MTSLMSSLMPNRRKKMNKGRFLIATGIPTLFLAILVAGSFAEGDILRSLMGILAVLFACYIMYLIESYGK